MAQDEQQGQRYILRVIRFIMFPFKFSDVPASVKFAANYKKSFFVMEVHKHSRTGSNENLRPGDVWYIFFCTTELYQTFIRKSIDIPTFLGKERRIHIFYGNEIQY